MSDELTIQGTLAETTVPDLCRSIIRSGDSAIVTLEAIGRHDNLYFQDGRIIYAATSESDLGLAEVLLRNGELSIAQYQQALESQRASRMIGSVLVELGFLKPDELVRAIDRQVGQIVMHALAFRSGSYTIEFTSAFDRDIPRLAIQTDRLILDGVAGIESWALISRGVGQMHRILRHASGSETRLYHLDLAEEESYVYSLLSDPQTVSAVCERSYLSNFATCRILWAFLAVNLIEDEEGAVPGARRSAAESEMELESRVERYNSAFQSIFNLVFQEIGDHIYDFVDRVVLHLSPETLPYLSGVNLMNEGRADYDQLLNNLISSGSTERAAVVDSILSELLYGWIFETRSEFGNRLEPQVSKIVEGLKRTL